MNATAIEAPFTLKRVQEMLGLSGATVGKLISAGFVTPMRGQRNEHRFSFQDLMLLRTAHALQQARIPPRKILRSLSKLKAELPAELPLTGLRITAVGADVVVRDRSGQWAAESGQLVLDFEVADVGGTVAFMAPAAASAAPPARTDWFRQGEALEASDRRGAEAAYRHAIDDDASATAAYLNLGALLCEDGRADEALALYEQASRTLAHEPLIHFNHAIALEDRGRQREALAAYERALALDATLADAHYNAGMVLEALGDAQAAIRHFSAYRRLHRTEGRWTHAGAEGRRRGPPHRPAGHLLGQAQFRCHRRTAWRARHCRRGPLVRRAEARGQPAALRLPARAGRRAGLVGRAQGAELRPGRQAHRRPRGGSPAELRRLRGHDPAEAVRRRQRDRVGQRPLGAGRRSGRGPGQGQAAVHAARPEADGVVGAGAHRQARRQAGAVDPVQEARRRLRQAAGRVRRADRAARQRDRQAVETTGRPIDPGRAPARQGRSHRRRREGKAAEKMTPQLATLAATIPRAGEWLCEIKFDGYRIMARIERGKARLITRGGHDWSDKMPELVAELNSMKLGSAWLDGEIVVLDDAGVPSFNRLQKAFDRKGSGSGIDYFLFDLPFFEGYDLREVPLAERRRVLKALLDDKGTAHVRYSADFAGDPASVLQSACRMKLEGIIAKRADAPYASRRTETWLKLKCRLRQEFVVAGYTDRSDGAAQIGSLLLGVYDDAGQLVSVGSVGTGWDAAEAAALKKQLAKLEVPRAPFAAGASAPGRWSRRAAGSERWVRPTLVAEVEYAEMTPDGQIRHATYVALRSDKPATEIRREQARSAEIAPPAPAPRRANAVQVTHPERVIDASTGLTKLDLVRYYESVAEYMLPHLKGRPCSLVRGPTGVGGQLFFQKHAERTAIPGIKIMDPALWPEHDALLEIPSALALAGAAQMNVIEFHTWNSTARRIDQPDRMIYDLDPGEGTAWPQVQEAALLVRGFLQELGLTCWLKTSGGKGLHVVVPLAPVADYDTVKGFSKAVVEHLARVVPSRFVAKSGGSNRVGKLFVDYLRNGHGATTAAAFSARARPGLGVSMPVSWDDLAGLKSGAQWTIADAREHLSFQRVDPWADYWTTRQKLRAAMQALGYRPPKPSPAR